MAETIHRRYIQIDSDTIVGYNYLKKKFYITNKETTTYRNTAEQAIVVLNVLGIEDYTAEELKEEIYNNYETLEKVYYTLEDGGSYIRTLQFNDWVGYPLEVDLEKKNIFIRNTEVLFSLELNESPQGRVDRFRSYYLETLGLSISNDEMLNAYRILANQYSKPYFYNELSGEAGSTTYKYTGSFNMANFNNSSAITCEGVKNPNELFSTQYLVNLESIDSANYTVNFQQSINPKEFKGLLTDSKIIIQGTAQDVEDTVYSSDGEYTITELINSSLGNKEWNCLTYGNSQLIALSSNGYISISTDGKTWSVPRQVKELGDREWIGIAYGDNKFIAISRFGYTSTYSYNNEQGEWVWTEATLIESLSSQEWTSITYIPSDNKFVALSYYGYYSLLKLEWSSPQLLNQNITEGGREGWVSLAYFNHNSEDRIIALNSLGYYAIAPANTEEPPSFIVRNKPLSKDSNSWSCIGYGDGELVALSSEGYTATGTFREGDPIWNVYQSDNLSKNNWTSITPYDNDEFEFAALGSTGYLSLSDGMHWSKATNKSDENIVGLQVAEPLLYDYQYPYPTCYVESISCPIESMERNENVIKILKGDFPQNLLVGDTIHVKNAIAGIEPEIVSCDGVYTVRDITAQIKQITDSVVSMGYTDNKNIIEINSTSTELKTGNIITIAGTNTSSDKSYTINEVISESGNVKLVVEEDIPYYYGSPYSTDQTVEHVEFIHTEITNAIKLPATFKVVVNEEDVVSISIGNETSVDYTVLKVVQYPSGERLLQLDGTLTANPDQSIVLTVTSMNAVSLTYSEDLYYNIYVEENIPTDFISSESHRAKFYKEVFIGNVIRISSITNTQSRLYFDSISNYVNLQVGNILYTYILGQKYTSKITNIQTLELNQVLIGTLEDESTPYIGRMPDRASISLQIPREDTVLTITDEHSYLNNIIPLGNFMVDSFEQCQDYVASLKELDRTTSKKISQIPVLGNEINESIFQELSKGDTQSIQNLDITFRGLYSEVYPS